MEIQWTEKDFLSCSGSTKLAREMAAAAPFFDLNHAIQSARDIWFNKVDVKGWLEAFAAHPEIGATSKPISQWSKEEQSTAMATAGETTMQELFEWNARYKERFGFVFLICASGRGSPEILAELKRRFFNRPIVELEIAAEEEMKVIELRLRKLFDSKLKASSSQTAIVSASKHEVQYWFVSNIADLGFVWDGLSHLESLVSRCCHEVGTQDGEEIWRGHHGYINSVASCPRHVFETL